MSSHLEILIICIIGFLASYLGNAYLIKNVRSLGIDHADGGRKQHQTQISRLGGLPVFISFALAFLFTALTSDLDKSTWLPAAITASLMFLVGLFDDLLGIGAKLKLAAQVCIALIAFGVGIEISQVTNPLTGTTYNLGAIALPATIFWLIAIPNIINLIDGMDGLASGLSLFICITLGIMGMLSHATAIALISFGMASGLLGFLRFNFPPAKIYLGDGGSYFIGYFIAFMSLITNNKGSVAAPMLVIMIAAGLPILDTFFAISRRAIRGVPLFRADADHIHHRLLTLGLSKRSALLVLYSICGIFSIIGIIIYISKGFSFHVAISFVIIITLTLVKSLGYIRSWKSLKNQVSLSLQKRHETQTTITYANLLELEVDRIETGSQFMEFLETCLNRLHLSQHQSPEYNKAIAIELKDEFRYPLYTSSQHPRSTKALNATLNYLRPPLLLAQDKWPQSFNL